MVREEIWSENYSLLDWYLHKNTKYLNTYMYIVIAAYRIIRSTLPWAKRVEAD